MDLQEKSICPACGKAIKIGLNFCTNCGVKLSEQRMTVTTSGTPTRVETFDKDWETLKQLVVQKNKKEILNFLAYNLTKLPQSNDASRKKIYDLIGKTLKEDPQFFKLRIFNKLYKKTNSFIFPRLRIEMEKYILEKYCFLKGEELITYSNGSVLFFHIADEIRGRFYMTNQRVIALGQHRAKTGKSVRRAPAGYGGIEFPYMGGIRLWRGLGHVDMIFPHGKKVEKFPYSRTSINIDQINKEKEARIDYVLQYEYEHKGKTEITTDTLRFEPLQEVTENEGDFQKRREMLFSKISECINSMLK